MIITDMVKEKGTGGATPNQDSPLDTVSVNTSQCQHNNSAKPVPSLKPAGKDVVTKTLWQKTVFRVYPNGDMYIDKTKSMTWWDKKSQVYKPKPKKEQKIASLKVDRSGDDEVY